MLIEKVQQLLSELEYPLEYDGSCDWSEYPRANCYTYALGLPMDQGFLIGDFIGKRMTHGDRRERILEVLVEELEELGFWVMECEVTDYVEDGCFKIYVEFDTMNNYHFLRQDAEGTWSHKSAHEMPNQTNYTGTKIINPEAVTTVDKYVGYCFMVAKTW